MPSETATFTSDITPLILAAHRDNYEIIKILLDRGCTLSLPHDARQVYLHYINCSFYLYLGHTMKMQIQ